MARRNVVHPTNALEGPLDVGALWHRWDPHVHAPGTVLNNQLGTGAEAWGRYLDALEALDPPVRGLGITDYYSVETYRQCVEHQRAGRLADCVLFPNVELRLNVGTVKGHSVNAHLLVSPEDPNHVEKLQAFLGHLKFKAFGDTFSCTPASLMDLGRQHDANATTPQAALRVGSEQFKVSLSELGDLYRHNDWARANVFIAISGTTTDGTSGLESGDAVLRQEIERFAHVIFASSPGQRVYWLGQGKQDAQQMARRYSGRKACMHGSDAHALGRVGNPDGARFTWIKGSPTFDGFRQAVLVPERAFVGSEPPQGILGNEVLTSIAITDAPWVQTPHIPLNPGLIAIIGSRGSGKTALADMIAAGCDASPDHDVHQEGASRLTFLERAGDLLGDAGVSVTWRDGTTESRLLRSHSEDAAFALPRVRYLSQQFVERLCSSEGINDELLVEVKRVVFEAQGPDARAGAVTFEELYDQKTRRSRVGRQGDESRLAELSQQIAADLEKREARVTIQAHIAEKTRIVNDLVLQRSKLVSPASEANLRRLQELETALGTVQGYIRTFDTRRRDLESLADDVERFRTAGAPDALRHLRQAHQNAGLSEDDWREFGLVYAGPVDTTVSRHTQAAVDSINAWSGVLQVPPLPGATLLSAGRELASHSRAVLLAEVESVRSLVTADQATANRYRELSQRIEVEAAALEKLQAALADADAASGRLQDLVAQREAAYLATFQWITDQQRTLESLYGPLRERIATVGGTLGKLSFTVERRVNVRMWAEEGESLLDLRGAGKFRGAGKIEGYAREHLLKAWTVGSPEDVAAAIATFRSTHNNELLERALVSRERRDEYRTWMKRLSRWVYSTEHVQLSYGIEYDGTDISKLSPGTRGIVLLQLYLGLDDQDGRPLIIDQPEENLDPRSIFSELVPLFSEAKIRRQVILVTHNANLVVNTDADQVIVATAGSHEAGDLPTMSYRAGSIDEPVIRGLVCDILEGGREAFQERARRLRVDLAAPAPSVETVGVGSP